MHGGRTTPDRDGTSARDQYEYNAQDEDEEYPRYLHFNTVTSHQRGFSTDVIDRFPLVLLIIFFLKDGLL